MVIVQLGYQTMDHLPINRGFRTHVGFLGGSESYSHGGGDSDPKKGHHDLWRLDQPDYDRVPNMTYSTDFYGAQAVKFITQHGNEWRNYRAQHSSDSGNTHSLPNPFFMYLAIQNVHTPYMLPEPWEVQNYTDMWDNTYANMLAILDDVVANVTTALHANDLWDNTLVVFTADNGGIGKVDVICAAWIVICVHLKIIFIEKNTRQ